MATLLLAPLPILGLGGCHVHSFEFKNETGRPIVLTMMREGVETSVTLPTDGHLTSLPGLESFDHIQYQYGGTICRIEKPFPKMHKGGWSEARKLRLMPCDGQAQ